MQKLNIVFNANTANYEEVVDSIYDVLRAGNIIENALSDGFQLTDLFDALKLEPIVREIIDDIPEFAAQFIRLSPDHAIAAVESAEFKLNSGGEIGKITSFILAVLKNAASSYSFADRTYRDAQAQVEQWKLLIPTKSV